MTKLSAIKMIQWKWLYIKVSFFEATSQRKRMQRNIVRNYEKAIKATVTSITIRIFLLWNQGWF